MLTDEDYDYSYVIPEDVLEDVIEAERKELLKKKKHKSIYPSSRDIVEAIIKASSQAHGMHPNDFPDLVYTILEEQGFNTKFVTVKRIWRVYENLVHRGVISDVLGVISYAEE